MPEHRLDVAGRALLPERAVSAPILSPVAAHGARSSPAATPAFAAPARTSAATSRRERGKRRAARADHLAAEQIEAWMPVVPSWMVFSFWSRSHASGRYSLE